MKSLMTTREKFTQEDRLSIIKEGEVEGQAMDIKGEARDSKMEKFF